jgi:hypothetical protein
MRSFAVKTYTGSFVVLGALLLGGCAPTSRRQLAETRERVALAQMERDKILAEMREMMVSLNGILEGIASDDIDKIERSARTSGKLMAERRDPQILSGLPENYRQLVSRTHQSFDKLAEMMKPGKAADEALSGLVEITRSCVACHRSYRFEQPVMPVSKYGPPPRQ